MKILIIGDSLTGNYGITPGKAWTELLKQDLNGSLEVKTYNGSTTADLLTIYMNEVSLCDPQRVFILGGTNDAMKLRPALNTRNNLLTMSETLEGKGIKTVILLPPTIDQNQAADIFSEPVEVFKQGNEGIIRLRRLLKDQSEEHSLLVFDLEAIKQQAQRKGIQLYSDGIHFTETFHWEIYEAFKSRFTLS